MAETDSRSDAIIRNNRELGQFVQIIVTRDDDNYTLYAGKSGIGLWDNSTSSLVGTVPWR